VLDAYILIQTQLSKTAIVAELVRAVPGVLETEIVTGPYDVVARAHAHDVDKLVTSQIHALPGVMRTVTCPIIQPSRGQTTSPRQTRRVRRQHRWATNGSLARLRRGRVNGPVTASKAHVNSTSRDYWDEASELAYGRAAVGKKRQDEMSHDVDQRPDAVRQPPTAPHPGARSQ
jgi:hypothetical protein